ncbi:acyloxyacyl hydrolase [Hymenobacter sp. B81]|uniref:acyloxyacyl hydrolase n=1 Tax=Hymenobacter sp. B81 TaxID=3344878 RepID=UPI0037DC9B87
MKPRFLFVVFALGLLPAGRATAQEVPAAAPARPGPLIVGAYAQAGFIIAHTPRVRHLVSAHPTGLELNVQRQLNGRQPWHAWYRYPRVGLALVYYDYHNPVLGRSYAASVYLNKLFWERRGQQLSFRMGTGVGYFPRRFDRDTNHKNTFVSSRLNATLQLRAEYDVALSPKLGLLMGVALNHYSNGATAKPNLGINIPTLNIGLNFHQQRAFVPLPEGGGEVAGLGKNFLNLSASAGIKQRNESDTRRYWVNSVTVIGGRRVNRKSNLLVGLEGFYDRSLLAEQRDTTAAGRELIDVKKAGVIVGHELLLGRLAFETHLGIYLYNPYKSNNFYYERIGLKYHFTERLFGTLGLKVHRGSADAIEWRLGVKL